VPAKGSPLRPAAANGSLPLPKQYLTHNNETPTEIAAKLGLSCEELLSLNKTIKGLRKASKFHENTVLHLPIRCPAEHHREHQAAPAGKASPSPKASKKRAIPPKKSPKRTSAASRPTDGEAEASDTEQEEDDETEDEAEAPQATKRAKTASKWAAAVPPVGMEVLLQF
jgi:hypothetical protein